ncbi:MAG TPA: mersacidin/lichenicidin family type 2 lantibiotic [Pyrinomonadaceae bacterium]|jgi:mersacidin/lichenicidin family type 2 lantibiotic|nr:mersacidin/lichenicidin family type 2 lantibiotic [Pyrinomonadaceae bacterium]
MNREQIIRAWKDEDFRSGLSDAERSLLPEHPAGLIDLSDVELDQVGGATADFESCSLNCVITIFNGTCALWTWGCCKKANEE